MAESQRFANLIQGELNRTLQLRDRGVKQAPFRVLMGATMPAVLVELGFISNPDEEKKLQDPAYRGQLVDALTRAIARYKAQVENQPEPTVPGVRLRPQTAPAQPLPSSPAPPPVQRGDAGPPRREASRAKSGQARMSRRAASFILGLRAGAAGGGRALVVALRPRQGATVRSEYAGAAALHWASRSASTSTSPRTAAS